MKYTIRILLSLLLIFATFGTSFSSEESGFLGILKEIPKQFINKFSSENINRVITILTKQEVKGGSRLSSQLNLLIPTDTVFISKYDNTLIVASKNKNTFIKNIQIYTGDNKKKIFFKEAKSKIVRVLVDSIKENKDYVICVDAIFNDNGRKVFMKAKDEFEVVTANSDDRLKRLEKSIKQIMESNLSINAKYLLLALLYESYSQKFSDDYDFSYNRDKYLLLLKNSIKAKRIRGLEK